MTGWTAGEHRAVFRALLSTWPDTLGEWGREVIAGYVGELEARGLAPVVVLDAIRSWPAGSNFPPSVPNLAAAARRDVSTPTFAEMLRLVYGPDGVFSVRVRGPFANSWDQGRALYAARKKRAAEFHPLVGSFVARYGIDRLAGLELDDPEHGEIRRRELQAAWEQHVEVTDERTAVSLASGSRGGGLGRLDPLAALEAAAAPVLLAGDESGEVQR